MEVNAIDDLIEDFQRACAAVAEQGDSCLAATMKHRAILRNEIRSRLIAAVSRSDVREDARGPRDMLGRIADTARAADVEDSTAPLVVEDSESTGKLLSPDIRVAIEKVDAECRRVYFGKDRLTRPLATIYEILAETREQGTDIPTAVTTAMFGNGYQLSHERRLLAILVARALPEIERLTSAVSSPIDRTPGGQIGAAGSEVVGG